MTDIWRVRGQRESQAEACSGLQAGGESPGWMCRSERKGGKQNE